MTVYASLLHTPDGAPMIGVALCHSGDDAARAEREVDGVRKLGAPVADFTGWRPYLEFGSMLDMTAPKGLHYYFKSVSLRELPDEAIETILHFGESAPSPQTNIILEHIHGAVTRVAPDATAASALRREQYSLNIIPACLGDDPKTWDQCVAWACAFAAGMERFGAGEGGYVNYLGDEGPTPVRASYGVNYARLAQIKAKIDPDNFFRFNQNIAPAAG